MGRVTLSSFRIHAPRGVYLLHASAAYFPPTERATCSGTCSATYGGEEEVVHGVSRKTVATKASAIETSPDGTIIMLSG